MKKRKIITIKDIANDVLMSTSTVSRALSGNFNISEDTRNKIQEAATRLGYKPNRLARSLQSGKSKLIGVILPDMEDTFFYEIYDGITETLNNAGWQVFVVFSREDFQREKQLLKFMEDNLVDGIIMCVSHGKHNQEQIQAMINKGFPFVFFDRVPTDLNVTTVEIDNEGYTYWLMESLIRKGFKKIAYVKAPSFLHYSQTRLNGYLYAMQKFKLKNNKLIFESRGMSFEDGVSLTDEIIEQLEQIEAIVVCDDFVALGIMHELQRKGINIPKDVAITGFGGSRFNKMVHPELTTVEFPQREMGKQAAKQIINKINNENLGEQHLKLEAKLLLRASSEK